MNKALKCIFCKRSWSIRSLLNHGTGIGRFRAYGCAALGFFCRAREKGGRE